jgi:hypothetical protein
VRSIHIESGEQLQILVGRLMSRFLRASLFPCYSLCTISDMLVLCASLAVRAAKGRVWGMASMTYSCEVEESVQRT